MDIKPIAGDQDNHQLHAVLLAIVPQFFCPSGGYCNFRCRPRTWRESAITSGGPAMTFDEMLEQTLEILQRRGRVSYRALKLQFPLDDALLAALKDEIVDVLQLAVDQEGTMLVWTGASATSPVSAPPPAVVLPTGTATLEPPTTPMRPPLPTPVAPQYAAPADAYAAPTSPADAERR